MREIRLSWEGKTSPSVAKTSGGKVERVLARPDGSALYRGNNLDALRLLAAPMKEKITLAYMDPPFWTGRVFETREKRVAFEDRWADRAAYLESLGARLELIRGMLAEHGCVVVHVDPKTSHYVKVLCDEIFGDDCFASEIVWRYRRWPSRTPNFQRVHDVLLRYRKSAEAEPRYNAMYEPLAPSTLATWGTKKQRAILDNKTGRRMRSSKTEQTTPGVPMGDVWDIGVIAPVARERTGYPSQKPEALLERLVRALSSPGELVLDPYAGSGTTLAVAERLGRRFVGIDESAVAIETAISRLAHAPLARVP